MVSDKPYMPHLSLLYADIEEAARKQLAEEEGARLLGVGSSPEEGGPGSTGLPATTFMVDAIEVWYTPTEDKSLKSWAKVHEVRLQGQ